VVLIDGSRGSHHTSTRTVVKKAKPSTLLPHTIMKIWKIIFSLLTPTTMTPFDHQLEKIATADGFIAALDQSGGSTPKALRIYGISDDSYVVGEKSMFDAVHSMRTRIMKSPVFNGERILGAILFEDTMDRTVHGIETAQYLWNVKNIVPFLKVDKGLTDKANGVQLMKPIPDLNVLLARAKEAGVFGTKMRSVITQANERGIESIVEQQFKIGKQIIAAGLIPIIEPEVDINCPEKKGAEVLLKVKLLKHLDALGEGEKVMLKLTLPSVDNFYKECIEHPKCLRVVALSGGYSRAVANEILARQHQMIASFSRALTEGLTHQMSDKQFEATLDGAIRSIFDASKSG
jgi:fructose-bisphosphate aldolase class I